MGIDILATAYLGTRQVNLRQKRAVKTPADLAGVKLRMPAGPEWFLLGRTLGISPVPLGMPEVYLAMKTSSIDGQENPLSIMNAAKLYEVSEQVVLTAHLLQPVFFAIAQPVWDKLNADQKKALGDAALKSARSPVATRGSLTKPKSPIRSRVRGLRSTRSISRCSAPWRIRSMPIPISPRPGTQGGLQRVLKA